MRRPLLIAALFAAGISAFPAWSLTLGEVGGVDLLRQEAPMPGNSGSKTLEAWVKAVLESDTDYRMRTESVSYSLIANTTATYAFKLVGEPGFFIIKNATNVALFENRPGYSWGVFDLDALQLDGWNLGLADDQKAKGKSKGEDNFRISFVAEFGEAPPSVVPVPGALVLLASGLLGLGVAKRRLTK